MWIAAPLAYAQTNTPPEANAGRRRPSSFGQLAYLNGTATDADRNADRQMAVDPRKSVPAGVVGSLTTRRQRRRSLHRTCSDPTCSRWWYLTASITACPQSVHDQCGAEPATTAKASASVLSGTVAIDRNVSTARRAPIRRGCRYATAGTSETILCPWKRSHRHISTRNPGPT